MTPIHPTSPENERATDALCAALETISINGVMTYAELSRVAGRDVQTEIRHLLDRARTRTEKNLGCIFECVRGAGITRLAPGASADVGINSVRAVHRRAGRGAERLARINANSLSSDEARRVVGYRSLLGAIATLADGNKARTVIARTENDVGPIPPKDVLKMFGG